ncbi:MAG: GNAT family N-acetyltransferase [Ruminococcaceae bacterium]|nr:GNAT family N-acetyltransferase [Oscillospiraceae bacterium]
MTFLKIDTSEKKNYLDLLLIADESEKMIDLYLSRGDMYALEEDGKTLCVCVVTDEGEGMLEIKNIAVSPEAQGRGYGRRMIEYVEEQYRGKYSCLQVGTGDSPLTIPFYEKCGFVRSHVIPNFFTDNYDHPIVECGVTLVDMVYLRKDL